METLELPTRPPIARAMILAAGFGTRLGAITTHRPKPMLPVCGAPLVRWAVQWLVHHGVRDIVINLHHLGEQIEAELADGRSLGAAIHYSPEHGQILGTGGGLRQARPLLDHADGVPIVIVNAKILLDLDLGAVLRAHRDYGAEATMVLRPDPQGRWGRPLRLDAAHRLVELVGERYASALEPVGEPLMFTGVHVVQPRFLDRIPAEGEQCIVRTAYRQALAEGTVFGVQSAGYWWEHSTPERYRQGVFNALDRKVTLPVAESDPGPVHPTATIHSDARIVEPVWIGAGVSVGAGACVGPYVQLGERVSVAAGVMVRRSIVWRGVKVRADLDEQIVVDQDLRV